MADLKAKVEGKQMQRDRVMLKSATETFDTTTDDKARAIAAGVIQATALRTTGYECSRKKDRDEFARLCTELVKQRGRVELLGIGVTIASLVKEHDLKTLAKELPEPIIKRLDKLV